jgi:putative photosynthetic complex assembly protein
MSQAVAGNMPEPGKQQQAATSERSQDFISRRAPYVLLALMALGLVAVLFARWTGLEPVSSTSAPVVSSVELRFVDGPAGSVLVYDWHNDDRLLGEFGTGEGSFVRGVLRSMTRERRSWEVTRASPFTLARHSDGGLTIMDSATGRQILLNAFGPTNAAVFARLLEGDTEATQVGPYGY